MKNIWSYKTLLISVYALCLGLVVYIFTVPASRLNDQNVKGDSSTVNVSAYIKTNNVRFKVYPEKRIPSTNNWHTITDVVLRNCTNVKVYTFNNVAIDDQGYGDLTIDPSMMIFDGPYRFYVKGYSHLNRRFNCYALENVSNYVDLTLEGKELLAGEVSVVDDNFINSLDMSVLINNIFSADYGSDLNQDSKVNSLDFSNQIFNLYLSGD